MRQDLPSAVIVPALGLGRTVTHVLALLQSLAERLAALEDSRLPALDARIDAVASAGPSQVRLRIWLLQSRVLLLACG